MERLQCSGPCGAVKLIIFFATGEHKKKSPVCRMCHKEYRKRYVIRPAIPSLAWRRNSNSLCPGSGREKEAV